MHRHGHDYGGCSPWKDWEFARGHRGRRARRGDIRLGLLAALTEGPAHGYELCQRLEAKSGGVWRPSSGSVYPTLQLLEDQGLVSSEAQDGKRVYRLTEAGQAEVAARAESGGPPPRPEAEPAEPTPLMMRDAMGAVHLAARQVGIAGTAAQRESALAILVDTRKKLYEVLAQG